MKLVPADLTQIAAKHEGAFPDAKVSDVIRSGGAVLGGPCSLETLLQRAVQSRCEQGAHQAMASAAGSR